MRYSFIILLSLLFSVALSAQDSPSPEAVRAVEEMDARYQLSEEQEAEALVIQERRLRNLAEIEYLKEQDRKLYLRKKDAIRQGTEASVQRMLNKEQLPILKQAFAERRMRVAELVQKMKEEGASQEEIQMAVWELE